MKQNKGCFGKYTVTSNPVIMLGQNVGGDPRSYTTYLLTKSETILTLLLLAVHSAGGVDTQKRDDCPSTRRIPVGKVVTTTAYACKGQSEVFENVTSGHCVNTKNFTTAWGWREGPTPEGIECSFNFYSSTGCQGPFVSAGPQVVVSRILVSRQ